METKNESEKIFEQYLDSNGFQGKWNYEPSIPGKNKRIDYLLDFNSEKYFFEVKELRRKPNQTFGEAAWIDPYKSLRDEINEARKKFREYKEYSCSLVVYNLSDLHARLNKPIYVFGAMLGNLGFTMDYDSQKGAAITGSEKNVFLNGGKMIKNKRGHPQNTTISAIIILKEYLDNSEVEDALKEEITKQDKQLTVEEKLDIRIKLYEKHHVTSVPTVVVIENPFAQKPFPKGLFNGPFDEHWKWREDLGGKIERIFAGDKLKKFEELKGNS